MSDEITWPDADVEWQAVLKANLEGWTIGHGVHVFVFKTREALQAAAESPDAAAHSRTYDAPDAAGIGGLMMLSYPVPLSIVAHEVTHMVLVWAKATAGPQQKARRWLEEHPEEVAEIIGNLTAVIWYSLPEELLET